MSYYFELPLRRVFLADLYGAGGSGAGAGASSATGSTTGSAGADGATAGSGAAGAAGAGAAFPASKSPNLDIVPNNYFEIIYQATSSTNSPRIFLFIFLDFRLLTKADLI